MLHKNRLKLNVFLLLFILSFCVYNPSISAQEGYWDFGGAIGFSNYSGDLSPPTYAAVIINANPAFSAAARYNTNGRFSVKLNLLYTTLDEMDSRSTRDWQQQRNLSFNTILTELSIGAEVNIFEYHAIESANPFTIYLTGGVAGFYFNPRAQYEGQWYALQKLGTEGQGLAAYPDKDFYSLVQIAIPMGGGLRYRITERLNLNVEAALRYTLTDYIDDISGTYADYNILLEERGRAAADLAHGLAGNGVSGDFMINDPDSVRGGAAVNDYYFIFNVGLSYDIFAKNNIRSFNSGKSRRRVVCPTF